MTSLVKYQEDPSIRKGNGRGPLSFNRAHVDGVPFRGPQLPLRDEEYNQYTEVVNDFDVGLFDIRNKEQYARLRDVFDKAANQWYQIVDYDKQWVTQEDGSLTVIVYVMWIIPHRELARSRVQAELLPTPVPQFPSNYQF